MAQADTIIPPGVQGLDRYAYVNNSPLNFVDPTGHTVACYGDRFDDGPQCSEDGSPSKWYYDNWKYQDSEEVEELEEELRDYGELFASFLYEPADWAISANHCLHGDCSPWMLLGLFPFIPSKGGQYLGKYGDELIALVGKKSYNTFIQLKLHLGSAGFGYQWHHIVEQSQILKSGFSTKQINSTSNIIAVDIFSHRKISGFYSSNIGGPGTQKVRDWLAGQSFEAQYEFGIQVLQKYGVIP